MVDLSVTHLIPSSGAEPSEAYDPISDAGYTEWAVDDEARFSMTVPNDYLDGGDVTLHILESTPTTGSGHAWEVSSILLRPDLHATNQSGAAETAFLECSAPGIAHRLTQRSLRVTGSGTTGRVGGAAIAAGDLLSFTMKRMTASGAEDPANIKVLGLRLSTEVSPTTSAPECSGRVAAIVETVRDLFNESTDGFLSVEFIVRCINRCRQELAQENYWRREAHVAAVAGNHEVSLLTALADYQDAHQVRFSGRPHPMTPLAGFQEYLEIRTASSGAGIPEYYAIQNDTLFVWPAPESDCPSGYAIYYSYVPPEITCGGVGCNPPVPKAHDMIFAYYVLKQAYLRDRHAPGADAKFREYSLLYERAKQALLGEADPPRLAVRSYR